VLKDKRVASERLPVANGGDGDGSGRNGGTRPEDVEPIARSARLCCVSSASHAAVREAGVRVGARERVAAP
jgi:hypothetical protein